MRARGGNVGAEEEHGKLLLSGGASEIWGWGSPAGRVRVQRRVEWIKNSCRLLPGASALECGCGTGIFTRQLAKSGASITAVDISQDLLDQAKQECKDDNVSFVKDNLEEPKELQDYTFDALYGVSVLHHLDLAKALSELRKKCKTGARFAFSEPNILNPINKYYMFVDDTDKRRQRGISPNEMAFHPKELANAFKCAGFWVENIFMRDFLHPAVPKLLITPWDIIGKMAELMPVIRYWSGSIWINGVVK